MGQASDTADEILNCAERYIRTRGYNGFSFRDIATDVGIRSASVHYHFPTKADLGAAVARRYTDRFLETVGNPDSLERDPDELLAGFVDAFRQALVVDGRMCLCGMLGAEVESLPDKVAVEAKRFFELTLDWLETVFGRLRKSSDQDIGRAHKKALQALASLQGAMLVARTLDDTSSFDQIADDLTPEGELVA